MRSEFDHKANFLNDGLLQFMEIKKSSSRHEATCSVGLLGRNVFSGKIAELQLFVACLKAARRKFDGLQETITQLLLKYEW